MHRIAALLFATTAFLGCALASVSNENGAPTDLPTFTSQKKSLVTCDPAVCTTPYWSRAWKLWHQNADIACDLVSEPMSSLCDHAAVWVWGHTTAYGVDPMVLVVLSALLYVIIRARRAGVDVLYLIKHPKTVLKWVLDFGKSAATTKVDSAQEEEHQDEEEEDVETGGSISSNEEEDGGPARRTRSHTRRQ
jgi:hypothetical protein